jgi:hypothetical protein
MNAKVQHVHKKTEFPKNMTFEEGKQSVPGHKLVRPLTHHILLDYSCKLGHPK